MAKNSSDIITIATVDAYPTNNKNSKMLIEQNSNYSLLAQFIDHQQALERCPQLKPDIIIIDTSSYPILLAKTFTKQIPATVLIMTTISDNPQTMQDFFRNGGRYIMSMPLAKEQLYELIQSAYNQYAPLREQFAHRNEPEDE